MSRIVDLPALVRGDRWSLTLTFTATDRDWTGTVVRCQFRGRDGRLIHDLGQASHITSSFTGNVLTVVLDVPGTTTAAWVGIIESDVELSCVSPAWGPYTPAAFRFEVVPDRTR